MPFKVFDEHLVNSISCGRVAAGIAHGTASTIKILPHHHGDFPDA
jgi:hypothetical protein